MGRALSGEAATQRLRDGGYRVTPQRRRVLEAVAALGHATPEQIHAEIRPDADLATIYRTLTLLEQVGLVQHTHLGHGSPTWSVLEDVVHLHLVCQQCQAVLEVPAGIAADLQSQLERQHGFLLDLGHLSLSGRCRQCVANEHETP
ncbi:MAG: nickel uptake regulator, Fur family [Frankiales bacterium]|nr:nickel uptake regulator, Fur family [Frankiales bacterium]